MVDEARRHVELGREAAAKIVDEDDRNLIEADLATIDPYPGALPSALNG